MQNSPLSKLHLQGREFFVKRDDLVHQYLCGNKFRKLHTLINTPKETFDKIISYGGTQSNAMLALAALCQEKEWEFIYYTKPMSKQQKIENVGNFTLAKNLGMQDIEIQNAQYRDFIASLSVDFDMKTYIVHQGGADRSAKDGLEALAQEIKEQAPNISALATPSGTGTTALYLALALPEYKVYTTACIGDSSYLKEQMSVLENIPDNLVILEASQKYHFAKPYKDFFEIYTKLQKAGIEFDLLYAPSMWLALLEHTDEEILYIHSGGVSGNVSMLQRYKKLNL